MTPDAFWDSQYARLSPVTDEAIHSLEGFYGIRLPPAYLKLIRHQNGGATRRWAFPTSTPTSWAQDHVPVEYMAGIGANIPIAPLFLTATSDDLWASKGLSLTWSLPDKQLLLEGDGHWWITMDYRSSDIPNITWIDIEEREIVLLSDSFEEFIRRLKPLADFEID